MLALPFYNSMIWQGTGMGNSSCVERITIFVSAARRMARIAAALPATEQTCACEDTALH